MTEDASPPPSRWPEFSNPERLDQIIDIIAEEGAVERPAIVPSATLESLGLASMDVVTILMGVEDKLDVYIPLDAELSSARNLAEFVGTIAKVLDAPSGAAADGK